MGSSSLFDLTGKKSLVTGGNSGLGLGFARGLAKQGSDVMLWSRNQERNRVAEEELRAFGVQSYSRPVDVSSEKAVVDGVAEAVETMGRLDCVIANAGTFSAAPSFEEMTSEMYHALLNTNQHGAFYTLREGARHMVERAKKGDPGGSLIICGSLSIFRGVPGMAHYGAAKGALTSMMRSAAVDLGKYGIRINVVAPGLIMTGEATWESQGGPPANAHEPDARHQGFIDRTPLGRLGYPNDFEGIAAYLASDASRYHTGDVITIDGGFMAHVV
jgi:NAD(P)-dependent dehydrogenase (short-subunit alcohol dehydrogenase family)